MKYFIFFWPIISVCLSKTVTYDWNIDWVNAAPDGHLRPTIGINGRWPPPPIHCDVGDELVVRITNNLRNETTGIHFHGISMNGSPQMDGVAGVSQCPIPPGSSITQRFKADPSGTLWYHSHNKAQYPDGLRGALIVHDPVWERSLKIEDQYTLTVSDWYHQQMPFLIHDYLQTGVLPKPDSSLMNDQKSSTFDVKPSRRYLFRLINVGALMAHTITFENHTMYVVAVDGAPVLPSKSRSLYIGAGQRYDVIIETKSSATENYRIVSAMDGVALTNTGSLRYSRKVSTPNPAPQRSASALLLSDLALTPVDHKALLQPVSRTVYVDSEDERTDIGPRVTFGNRSYILPKVPSLYTALTVHEQAANPEVYGAATNPVVIGAEEIVQVVIRTHDKLAHPIHLHGHRFQILARGSGAWQGDDGNFPQTPVMRDTAVMLPDSHLVIRFRADNPGVWPMHCHMEFHTEAGMRMTFIEAPGELQRRNVRIPPDHLAICRKQGIKVFGNCAGDAFDVLNTKSCNNKQLESDTWGSLVKPPLSS